MKDEIEKRIAEENQDEALQELVKDLCRDVRQSRNFMSKAYPEWDRNLATYKSMVEEDSNDLRAAKKKEPTKQTIPFTYSSVNTAVAYVIGLYFQGQNLFELAPTGDEDYALREICDAVLAREVRANKLEVVLSSFFLDVFRFNLGVTKTLWEEQEIEVEVEEEVDTAMTFSLDGSQTLSSIAPRTKSIVINQGSVVTCVSPYNFFPDTRLPLKDWRKGQFAADEQAINIHELKQMERVGAAAGTKWVERMSATNWEHRERTTRLENFVFDDKDDDKDFMVLITDVQCWINPADYDLGPDGYELWHITIANDERITFAERVKDASQEFTYDLGQMSFDECTDLGDSLASCMDKLQETATWLLNSRIASVRKNTQTQLIVHPSFIETSDLEAQHPYIRLKRSVPPGMGVDNYIQQLRTVDPTATNMADMSVMIDLIERVTGVNGNMMGQFHSGRRAATEARNVQAGAAARMAIIARQNWVAAMAPLGRRLLMNARQWMDQEIFTRIVGKNKEQEYAVFHQPWYALIGSEDFFVYDGTSQNEKNFTAQSLQELVLGLMSSPEILAASGINPIELINEIQRLRGVRNLTRFTNGNPTIPLLGQTNPAAVGQGNPGAAAV